MIRTTTPTHILTFPFDPATIDELWVTYSQDGMIVMEKQLGDVTIDSEANTVEITLTQAETKQFNVSGGAVLLQVKARQGETVMASDVKTLRVLDVLNDELMGESTA